MRTLWIFVEFPYRRRTGEEDGRIRSGKDKRLDVCGGGRVLRLMCGLVFKSNRQTLKYVWTRLTIDVYCMSRGTGAKCAGGIDKEHLMRYDVVQGKSIATGDLLVRGLTWLSASVDRRAGDTMKVGVSMRYKGDQEDRRTDVLSTRDCSFAGQRARGEPSPVSFL